MGTSCFNCNLVKITCGECGAHFGISEQHHNALKKSGSTFYCPNGHSRYYPKVDKTKVLEQEIEWLKNDRENLRRQVERGREIIRCPMTGCDYFSTRKFSVRKHLEKEHSVREHTHLLPENAGPDAKNSDVH